MPGHPNSAGDGTMIWTRRSRERIQIRLLTTGAREILLSISYQKAETTRAVLQPSFHQKIFLPTAVRHTSNNQTSPIMLISSPFFSIRPPEQSAAPTRNWTAPPPVQCPPGCACVTWEKRDGSVGPSRRDSTVYLHKFFFITQSRRPT